MNNLKLERAVILTVPILYRHQHADLPQAPSSHDIRTQEAAFWIQGREHPCDHHQHKGRCIASERASADMLTQTSRYAHLLQMISRDGTKQGQIAAHHKHHKRTSLDSEDHRLNSDDRLLHSDEGSEKSVDDCVSTTQYVSDMT